MHGEQNSIFFRQSNTYETLFLIGMKIIYKSD